MPRALLPLGLIWLLLSGCGASRSPEELRQQELHYLSVVVPEELLEYSHLEIGAADAVKIHDGSPPALQLTLAPEQARVNRGNRAELSVDFPCTAGETVRYAWQFMLPEDFALDAPRNRWWLIGQWHDQPNRTLGETWDGHSARSPTVAISIGENQAKETCLAFNYGTDKIKDVGPVPIKRGVWHNIAVVITWSQDDAGRGAVYLDDRETPVLEASGPNMHNDFQHYLKLGMYRHPEIRTRNSIFIRKITIEQTTPPGK